MQPTELPDRVWSKLGVDIVNCISAVPETTQFAITPVDYRSKLAGKSFLARKTLHDIGLATNPDCKECREEDSVLHLLTECPAYADARARLWGGPLPSLECVLGGSAHKIFEYLRRVGRVDPPVDAATADAVPVASAGREAEEDRLDVINRNGGRDDVPVRCFGQGRLSQRDRDR